jgi:hypothetical protein
MQKPSLVRTAAWTAVLTLFALVAAQPATSAPMDPCLAEVRAAAPGAAPRAVMAVELLARIVTLVEPSFPALRGGQGPIAADEPGAAAARFLHRRYLLPEGWSPETYDDAQWRAMLRGFAARYRAEATDVVGGDRAGMIADAERTLVAVIDAVRPLAVFATGPDEGVTFFAVIWNWTPAPRLMIMRPPEGLALGPGRESAVRAAPVLEAMSTCALRFASFVYAPEDVALRVFVQQGESIMRVLASDPPRDGWPLVIPAERVVDGFRFEDPTLAGVRTASVSIEGPSIGIGTAIRVLATVRTNIGLDGILYHLAIP